MNGDFFKGNVRFISQGIFNAKYSVLESGAIIKVKNSTHVRLINQFGVWPDFFEIIAPMGAVKVQSGKIPNHYIEYLNANEYLRLRMQYDGC